MNLIKSMNRVLFSLAATGLLLAGFTFSGFAQQNKSRRVKARISKVNKKESRQDDMARAMKWEWEITHDPRTGTIPNERLAEARRFQLEKLTAMQAMTAVPGLSWTERGPNNVGGRTRALIYDRNDATSKKVWAGGMSGGLWSTTDITAATPVWTKSNDFHPNLVISTLAQHPTTPLTMYAGTGEGWFNFDAQRGAGIYKTTNGGTLWTQLASTNNSNFFFVQKVVVTSTGIVLAATHTGVRRSADGGATWTLVLGSGTGGSASARAADLEIGRNGAIYCSMGIFNADGIYRSINGGLSWTKIYTSATDEGRIELATAPTDSNRVYAMLQDMNGPDNVSGNADDNRIKKLMRTSNSLVATPTWTTLGNPAWCDAGAASTDFTRTQSWYDAILSVDPLNAAVVVVGGVDMHRSTNSGTSWTQISQWLSGCGTLPVVHADIHAITFKPGSSTEFLAGTDGGIYRTINSGTAFTQRNNGYNVTQFYGVAIHPTAGSNYFLAGAQDNGTQRFNAAGINSTLMVRGGDGGFPHIDQDNANIQITSYTGNSYSVSTNGGGLFTDVGFAVAGEFINPTDYDNASNVLYGAVATGGSYLRWMSPGVTPVSAFLNTVAAFGGQRISAVQIGKAANRVYFGFLDGRVIRVDAANTAAPVAKTLRPAGGGAVSSIAVDMANALEDHLLVTYSNYGVTSVFETANAQSLAVPTWTAVEGNLPDMPVRWVIFDPRNSDWAILATELGVWSTQDLNGALTDWDPTNTNLANVRVDQLQRRASDCLIAAATHGRGLYTTAYTPCTVVPAPIATPVAPAGIVKGDGGLNSSVQIAAIGGQPAFNLYIQNSDVYQVEVFDAAGKLLRRATVTGNEKFDMQDHGHGLYIIQLTNNRTKERSSRKLVL